MKKLEYVTINIDAGVPMPEAKLKDRRKTRQARIVWPFADMTVGDSFLIPDWAEVSRWQAAVSSAKVRGHLPRDYKFKMRETEQGMRVWRVQ